MEMTTNTRYVPLGKAKGRDCHIISVASGKGGIGKTWLATTLAHALADADRDVLLFDGDLSLPNVDIQLGIVPEHGISTAIYGDLTLNQVVIRHEEGGFDVITGCSGQDNPAKLSDGRLQALCNDLAQLCGDYDYVLLDLSTGINLTVRQFLACAHTCLIITNDEPTALTDSFSFIRHSHTEFPHLDIKIIVTMDDSIEEGQRTYTTLLSACKGFLNISPPIAGVVQYDDKVSEEIRSQTPIFLYSPDSKAMMAVTAIAENLLNHP